jgi:poly(hydroxyalkanoate) depolymerase family esterase
MTKGIRISAWTRTMGRQLAAMTRLAKAASRHALARIALPVVGQGTQARGAGLWAPGVALGPAAARRFRLYQPPGIKSGERLPLLVMLHGCRQDADGLAVATRMNGLARRERFLVLYPEQDRLANLQGCWNWYGIDNGRAAVEVASIMQAIDQVCRLQPVDGSKLAVAGLSAGASMAALLAERHPDRFKALVMHSGIAPGAAHSGPSALAAMRGQRPTPPRAATSGAMATARPPLLLIHGDADTVVSPANSRSAAQVWAEAAGARAGPSRTVRRGQRYPMTVTDFKRAGITAATWVVVHGLAHAWSGGAGKQPFSDPRGPDASRLAWAFASNQFRISDGIRIAAASRRVPGVSAASIPPAAA